MHTINSNGTSHHGEYRPTLFTKLGGIKGLTSIFDAFFESLVKNKRLSKMYNLSEAS